MASTGGGDASGIDSGSLPLVDCGALGRHYFCDDFSETTLPGLWDDQSLSGGTVSLDTSQSTSSPQALLASTTLLTTGTRTYARLEKHFSVSGTRFQIAFAEWVDPGCIGSSDTVQTGNLALSNGTYFVAVGHGTSSDSILETTLTGGVYLQAHDLSSPLPRGRWAHITLNVDVGAGTLGLTQDGNVLVSGEPMKYPPPSPQVPMVSVGTLTDGSFDEAACKVWIDDVTVDVQP